MTQNQWLELFLAVKDALEEDAEITVRLHDEKTGHVSFIHGGRETCYFLNERIL